MDDLDRKLNDNFAGYVVRKDLVKLVKGNAAVPSYVLEYLLGQNCATDDEEEIQEGVERVRDILAAHYVQRAEAGAIRSDIKQSGFQRIIDKVSVELVEKRDAYEATFENLGVSHVLVTADTVKKNRRLLVSGVWCIADLSYSANEAKDESPYILKMLKPIQMARFDLDDYVERRKAFTSSEWIDALIRSIGLDPAQLGERAKLFQLTRLIPYCERNYNLVELGPKGTGKSHVFSEFSPHGILISGGEVTPAKLFVNNSTGKIGLVGYWDCVAFDEFAGKNKRPKPDIVDILKNYMANKSFSRGIEQVTAEASLAFVGNTSHDVSYMINQTDLFEDLPAVYHDSAFIDRIHAYIPGWEVDIIRGDMFSSDYGFIVDYLAEALRSLRALDYSGLYRERFELSDDLSTRDRDGVLKTYSGLMKIIFPGKDATAEEEARILEFAMELRKRVKDQLYRIDETFARTHFRFRQKGGAWRDVTTLEEVNFPRIYHSRDKVPLDEEEGCLAAAPAASTLVHEASAGEVESTPSQEPAPAEPEPMQTNEAPASSEPFIGHREYRENQRGVSYERLFGPYLEGVRKVEIIDPYIRKFYQCRNLMELLEVILSHFDYSAPEVSVHLTTVRDDDFADSKQDDYLQQVADAMNPLGLSFTYDYDETRTIHDRKMVINDTWEILLGRGLDIWQYFDAGNAFAVETNVPEVRKVKEFGITYLRK
ncbi:BREX system Lon protease-like protein BrxL [Olsenella sp. kh2p3]|uniref:BREX system Lon protease-like protein BrxL n=1 Tax=Olsenella sp. kh2p3 TaxID=1797112 RepID=UPI00091BCF61|nr:BREX system Lon protease-like protein BrxL [Olsenella sp. kh2p3]SFW99857.1 ATP-dependent Lon protease [Olsenella sp. kh2p3]